VAFGRKINFPNFFDGNALMSNVAAKNKFGEIWQGEKISLKSLLFFDLRRQIRAKAASSKVFASFCRPWPRPRRPARRGGGQPGRDAGRPGGWKLGDPAFSTLRALPKPVSTRAFPRGRAPGRQPGSTFAPRHCNWRRCCSEAARAPPLEQHSWLRK
jgi:hypothetical protein